MSATAQPQPQPIVPLVYTQEELSAVIKIPVRTLREWRRHANAGPQFTRAGKHVLYSHADVIEWLAANKTIGGAA